MNHQLITAYLSISLCLLTGCGQTEEVSRLSKHSRPVQVFKLQNSNRESTSTFSGVTKSINTAQLSFRVPGTIYSIDVAVGEHVKKGQIIASIDPHDYKVQQQELKARLDEAESAHKLAKIELDRVQQAVTNNAAAHVNLDRARSGFERTKAMVEVVKQNLNKANDALRYSTLKAPFSGVIGQQNIQPFEQVAPGIPAFTLHKPDQLEVIIDVPENLVHHFNSNTPATVSWYGAEHPVVARISDIGTVSHVLKQTYPITFKLLKNNDQLLPGKSVKVEVTHNRNTSGFCLPYSAIKTTELGHQVFIVNNKTVEEKYVNIVDIKSNSVCISGQLSKNDNVVVMGTSYLKHGDSISTLQFQNTHGELL